MLLSPELQAIAELVITKSRHQPVRANYSIMPRSIFLRQQPGRIIYVLYRVNGVPVQVAKIPPDQALLTIQPVPGLAVYIYHGRRGGKWVSSYAAYGNTDDTAVLYRQTHLAGGRQLVLAPDGSVRKFTLPSIRSSTASYRIMAKLGDSYIRATHTAGGVLYRRGVCLATKDLTVVVTEDEVKALLIKEPQFMEWLATKD